MYNLNIETMTYESLLSIDNNSNNTSYESDYPELDLFDIVTECAEAEIAYEEELVKLNKIQTAIKVRNLTMENANNIALEDGEKEVKKNIFKRIWEAIVKFLKKLWSWITWPFRKLYELFTKKNMKKKAEEVKEAEKTATPEKKEEVKKTVLQRIADWLESKAHNGRAPLRAESFFGLLFGAVSFEGSIDDTGMVGLLRSYTRGNFGNGSFFRSYRDALEENNIIKAREVLKHMVEDSYDVAANIKKSSEKIPAAWTSYLNHKDSEKFLNDCNVTLQRKDVLWDAKSLEDQYSDMIVYEEVMKSFAEEYKKQNRSDFVSDFMQSGLTDLNKFQSLVDNGDTFGDNLIKLGNMVPDESSEARRMLIHVREALSRPAYVMVMCLKDMMEFTKASMKFLDILHSAYYAKNDNE